MLEKHLHCVSSLSCAVSVTGIVFAGLMLIIVYNAAKSQGKIRKISPSILLSAEEYRDSFSPLGKGQGKDMLLALFFLLYALICILMCRLKSVPAHHRIEYPALLCVL